MNNFCHDKITYFISSHHRKNILWECVGSCRFQCNTNANFVTHKASKKCSMYNGPWFQTCVKKGMKSYYHIRHKYFWDRVMDDIRK